MDKKKLAAIYFWIITSSHVISYFIAGIFAVVFMNYKDHYASQTLSLLMKPVDSQWVALGPALQIFRGVIISAVLYPFRKIFLDEDNGAFKLALLISGLSFVSTIGPAPGSFEGYIYTILPVQYHLLGIPETVIYVLLFSFLSVYWYKNQKRIFIIISVIAVAMIALMSLMGYLKATGVLKV